MNHPAPFPFCPFFALAMLPLIAATLPGQTTQGDRVIHLWVDPRFGDDV